jgi:hypothetical protein
VPALFCLYGVALPRVPTLTVRPVMTHDPVDLEGQREAQEQAATRNAAHREMERADWEWLMADPRGRRLVRQQLERSGVFRTSFSESALQMAFHEGQRNTGLALLAMVQQHVPERYQTMMQERPDAR